MLINLKNIKELVPPIFLRLLPKNEVVYWRGVYQDWKQAENKSNGYDADNIIKKVRDAAQTVKEGGAIYERDSFLFYSKDYDFPVVSSILWACNKLESDPVICDFGGALGSSYVQNQDWFKGLDISWNIIEQQKLVKIGKEGFESEKLKFYSKLEELNNINILLFNSVFQYLERPWQFIEAAKKKNIRYIIFDKTPFSESSNDLVTIQYIKPPIYRASYPCRVFSQPIFISRMFDLGYQLKIEFTPSVKNEFRIGDISSEYKGFIFALH